MKRCRVCLGVAGLLLGLTLGPVQADPAYPSVNAVELYHAGADRYFLSVDAAEVAALASSGAWKPTGQVLLVSPFTQTQTPVPVRRFFHAGLFTHLWTAHPDEIAALEASPDWVSEGVAFYSHGLGRYGCYTLEIGTPTDPYGTPVLQFNVVKRFYHPVRGIHRLVLFTEYALIEQLQAEGWRDEGAALCANPYLQYP